MKSKLVSIQRVDLAQLIEIQNVAHSVTFSRDCATTVQSNVIDLMITGCIQVLHDVCHPEDQLPDLLRLL